MNRPTLPVIGIATRSIALPGKRNALQAVFSSYINCLGVVGGEAVLLPPGALEVVERLNGLLLVGGEDLSTGAWWSEGSPCTPSDPERDLAESRLVERSRSLGIPLLGICRGAQLANCVCGGSIARFDSTAVVEHSAPDPADSATHLVRVAPNTRLASAMGLPLELSVVSRHTTRIDALGEGLLASARAKDGSTEAIEASDWPFLGVQWHPEWSTDDAEPNLKLFHWLVDEAKRRIQR